MKIKFYSKISPGLLVFVIITLVGTLIATSIKPPYWVGSVFILPSAAFVFHLFVTTYYTIEEETLVVRSGFFANIKIKIDQIQSILPTNNIISAPALSFDRLVVKYTFGKEVVISPKNKERFIDVLVAMNPKIKI